MKQRLFLGIILCCLGGTPATAKPSLPSSAKIATPSLTSKNSLQPFSRFYVSPQEFNGDGTYDIATGDTVHLANGVDLKIRSIAKLPPESDLVFNDTLLFVDFSIQGERLNAAPVPIRLLAMPFVATKQNYAFQGYGATISLPGGNGKTPSPYVMNPKTLQPRYALNFQSPLPLTEALPDPGEKVASGVDLFNYCLAHEQQDQPEEAIYLHCLYLVSYTPLAGEMKLANDQISLIGPADQPDVVNDYFKQASICYALIQQQLQIEPLFLPIPIRITNQKKGGGVTTSLNGVLIGVKGKPLGGGTKCAEPVLSHEMVHYFVAPAPLQNIYDEGLATTVEWGIVQPLTVKLLATDFEISKPPVLIPPYDNKLLLQANTLYQEPFDVTDRAVFQYGNQIQGVFQPIGKPFSVAVGNATAVDNPNVPIIHLKEAVKSPLPLGAPTTKLDLYASDSLVSGLRCRLNGYQENIGWMTETGTTLYADEKINPILPFAPLSKYNPKNYLSFYKTAACFWREIDQQSGLGVVMKGLRKYQGFKNTPFPFFDLLSAQGIDIAALKQKFGINADAPNVSAYMPLSGNLGQYGP